MKTALKGIILASLFLFSTMILGCNVQLPKNDSIRIADIKIATGVDENLMPLKILDILPKETTKIFCWFKWRNAKVNTVVLAKWHYVTDDIPILDNAIVIPRKEGTGSVSLSMPEGKTFPVGTYRVDLLQEKQVLKSCSFKVQ